MKFTLASGNSHFIAGKAPFPYDSWDVTSTGPGTAVVSYTVVGQSADVVLPGISGETRTLDCGRISKFTVEAQGGDVNVTIHPRQ